MRSLPTTCISVMAVFAPVFSKPGWQPVKGLLTGAILARDGGPLRQRSVSWGSALSPTCNASIASGIELSGRP
jgi:hypothetical protein